MLNFYLLGALDILTAENDEIQKFWTDYLDQEYENGKYLDNRSYFDDMDKIADYIAENWRKKEYNNFKHFFDTLENIFTEFDLTTCSIISAGLLESIQAHKGVDYYLGFNQWLKPNTLKWWKGGIEYWERRRERNDC
jgi:hypothetical protein